MQEKQKHTTKAPQYNIEKPGRVWLDCPKCGARPPTAHDLQGGPHFDGIRTCGNGCGTWETVEEWHSIHNANKKEKIKMTIDTKRLNEYEEFNELLNICRAINHSTNIIENLQKIEKLSESLTQTNIEKPRPSFQQFIGNIIAELNQKENAKND